jgi:hypothetical protein
MHYAGIARLLLWIATLYTPCLTWKQGSMVGVWFMEVSHTPPGPHRDQHDVHHDAQARHFSLHQRVLVWQSYMFEFRLKCWRPTSGRIYVVGRRQLVNRLSWTYGSNIDLFHSYSTMSKGSQHRKSAYLQLLGRPCYYLVFAIKLRHRDTVLNCREPPAPMTLIAPFHYEASKINVDMISCATTIQAVLILQKPLGL